VTGVIWVSLSYATFGIEVEDDIVIKAPPVAAWMHGKHWQPTVLNWIIRKNGIWRVIG
jgi:hypothetical protein